MCIPGFLWKCLWGFRERDVSAGIGEWALGLVCGPGGAVSSKGFSGEPGQRPTGVTGWGGFRGGEDVDIPPCMPRRCGFARRVNPTFGGRAVGKCCNFRPCQGALERFRTDRATGLSCGQGRLLEEETYTTLAARSTLSWGAVIASLARHTIDEALFLCCHCPKDLP